MNSAYSRVLASIERYVEVMDRLASALQLGQEAHVRMDLPAFEQLTAEQDDLCQTLKRLQAASRDANPGPGEVGRSELSQDNFQEQRALLEQRCLALERRVRHLNQVNHFFLNRARQSFALLLRLVELSQATYSLQPTTVPPERLARRE